jgi:putative aminopeptidase FrvX
MSHLKQIDKDYLTNILQDLILIPSPTGMAGEAIEYIEKSLEGMGIESSLTKKGGLISEIKGQSDSLVCALTAHLDTLGAMVKEIKPSGRLKLSKVGGFAWNSIEGEGCTVHTHSGENIRGSILLTKASSHVYGAEVNELKREDDTLEVRLDLITDSEVQTREAGIEVGDFVSFDPRLELSESGFIRARHLDDKAGVACMLAALKWMHDSGEAPARHSAFHFSNYEEVGHGAASGFPGELSELVAIDMAAVGEGQQSDEFHTTICVKDSGGPYHIELTRRMRKLAEQHEIPFRMDIYPYYGSDAEAYWRAGGDVQIALIGPGVDASHNYERTHLDSLIATTQLILAYLLDPR